MSATSFSLLGEALRDAYALEREIGSGGMATVYLAEDLRHRRRVAVKVLRPELGTALGPDRFLREVEVAAHLQHPHILPLFDSGRIGESTFYYVMPYVAGESLRQRLGREGPLPIEEALRLAREVADALGYAHEHGIVHRDIKPENILLVAGHAVVADFGIARAVGRAGGEELTGTGIALGTPQYMSPEQASASRDLDGRSDIYALGCVLYEMLTGAPPFTGASAQAVLARHAVDPVSSIRTVRGTVPQPVELVVLRALAKVPADRYPTAGDFAKALGAASRTETVVILPTARGRIPRWAIGLAASAVIAVMLGWWAASRRAGRADAGDAAAAGRARHSVAVLSFANLSPDTADAYLAQGIGEEIAARLVDFPGVRVAGRGAVGRLERADTTDLLQQARQLGVGYLVEGSVRRAGPRVRVSVRLVNASDGFRTWSRSYDHGVGSVLDLQDQVGADVARAVGGGGAEPGARRRSGRTRDPAAYDQLLRASYYTSQRNPRSFARAIQAYEEAVRLDPSFALAYGRLAYAYSLLLDWGWTYRGLPRDSVLARAERAADRALQLDSTIAQAWQVRSEVAARRDPRTLAGALEAGQRAVALDPTNAEVRLEFGYWLRLMGNDSAAKAQLLEAIALEPDLPMPMLHLAWIDAAAKHYADARRWLDSAIVVHPGFFQGYAERAAMRLVVGDTAGARADAETAVRLRPAEDRFTGESTLLALERRTGDTLGLRRRLTALRSHAPKPDTVPVHAAVSWAAALVAAGAHEAAIEFVERVRADPPHLRLHLKDVHFDPVRSDPRVRRLLRPTD
ncbi:MAG TPA: protein kinase [Gemmatimonadales bacterium]|nr:protein kinase [Gemmatimonadales bacterium]